MPNYNVKAVPAQYEISHGIAYAISTNTSIRATSAAIALAATFAREISCRRFLFIYNNNIFYYAVALVYGTQG